MTSVRGEINMVEIFTDGACKGNPGVGGWGAILRFAGTERELFGGVVNTTNNRMELTAVIEGLRALKHIGVTVEIVCDSQYVVCTMTKGWKRKANHDLWQALDAVIAEKQPVLTWRWVRGHAGDPMNEHVHKLVMQAREA